MSILFVHNYKLTQFKGKFVSSILSPHKTMIICYASSNNLITKHICLENIITNIKVSTLHANKVNSNESSIILKSQKLTNILQQPSNHITSATRKVQHATNY